MKGMFPINHANTKITRFRGKYKVTAAKTDRLKDSALPYMQRLLNSEELKSQKK